MDELKSIKAKLNSLENVLLSAAPIAESSPIEGPRNKSMIPEHSGRELSRAKAIEDDFRRQFPQYQKRVYSGTRSNQTSTKKVKMWFQPKTTFTTNFCCLSGKDMKETPNISQLLHLNKAGLGKRRIEFDNKMGDHTYLVTRLERAFPKLMSIDGAFYFYKAMSGGGGNRPLIKLPMDRDGYSIPWLRGSCNVNSSSTIYIKPIQEDLDEEALEDEDDCPSVKCVTCGKYFSISSLEKHTEKCSMVKLEKKPDLNSVATRNSSSIEFRESDQNTQENSEEVAPVLNEASEVRKICSQCSCSFVDDCLICQQNVDFEESLAMDLQKIGESSTQPEDNLLSASEENLIEGQPKTVVSPDLSVDDLRARRVARFEATKNSEANSTGTEECRSLGDDEVSSFFKKEETREVIVIADETHDDEKVGDEANDEKKSEEDMRNFLEAALNDYKNRVTNAPEKVVLIQRSRLWSVLFRNKFDMASENIRVIFAGEGAVDDGGPYREFLRLVMINFFNVSDNLLFGKSQESLFTADPQAVLSKRYYMLGQLSACAILEIGRGPECLHPELGKYLFGEILSNEISFEDATFDENLKNIKDGNLDVLFDCQIMTNDQQKAIMLYSRVYALYQRSVAIQQYKDGVCSIIKDFFEHPSLKKYFLQYKRPLSCKEVLNILNYVYQGEEDSNIRNKEEEAMIELEFLITHLSAGKVKGLELSQFLVFVTACDRIPPCNFSKKIDVYFDTSNKLPRASTCGLTLTLPVKDTREKLIYALRECQTLSSV